MERRTIRVPAPPGSPYLPAAGVQTVGDEFDLDVEGKPFGTARCVAAEVVDDGAAMLLTLEAEQFPPETAGEPSFAYDVDAMEADPVNRGQKFPR